MALSAAPEIQAQLLTLADIDVALARAKASQSGLASALHIPTLVAALEEIRGRRHEAFVESENIRSELARAESDVQIVDKRIATDEERLASTSSAKDAQGLEHELESLRQRRSNLEDIELAIMERLDFAQAVEAQLAAELGTAEAALEAAKAAEGREGARLEGEISSLRATRQTLVSSLPEDLVALYERQRERYGVGASHLRGGLSSASGVALTESDLHAIRQAPADAVVMCPDSNAILVRTAESGL
jgi:predicted  nucleic acid-binding Zn-ribbon protein